MSPTRVSYQLSLLAAIVAMAFVWPSAASAQTCYAYVDGCSRPDWPIASPHASCVNAKVPIQCVRQGTLLPPCRWSNPADPADGSDPSGGDCHRDGVPCCTSVTPTGVVQSVLEMHTKWHECFGNVGDPDGDNPPGRGQRWYAFHRQFEFDFNIWRRELPISPIESLPWCPGMTLDVGHDGAGLAAGEHPAGCGRGPNRPGGVACPGCVSFPQCLFKTGAGPGCATPPSSTCGIAGLSFPYTSLADFRNVEEVSTILDHFFHGQMHGAVAAADSPGTYVQDLRFSNCSPRDPMFWRLHKALDDVVRSWQNLKPVDVILVIDRSGSMTDPDASGSTKFAAALTAVDNFADLLDIGRPDGQNRIGLVSYSNSARVDMELTAADANLRAPGGPLANALNALSTDPNVPGGCTGIGAGIKKALEQLCPTDGDCTGFSADGDNDRKAILVLTDGIENVPPCLNSFGPPGATCGSQCFGDGLDFNLLEFTQVVAVGFGNTGSLNGDLLTLLAERQGGIYLQNPNAPGDDLKKFFTNAFGELTSDFTATDPKGVLAAGDAASEIVEYGACGDSMVTFASGWQRNAPVGSLRLQVTTPSHSLVRDSAPGVRNSTQRQWAFSRVRFPHGGESGGTWTGQLIRPHQTFVNGFTPDSFVRPSEGVNIVRREIQRLCPDGCKDVLYFEHQRRGRESAYEAALKAEKDSGLVERVERVEDPRKLNEMLGKTWDLIVYARMGEDTPAPYDSKLAELVCGKQKAIITDTRAQSGARLLRCAGVVRDGTVNWPLMDGDNRLFTGKVKLDNPGHAISSYGMRSAASVQATARVARGTTQAVVARVVPGEAQNWFINVLADGLSRLSPVRDKLSWNTGQDLMAVVRVLPSDLRAGGYDHVDARVEVEYPTVGLGSLLSRQVPRESRAVKGERLDPRAAALAKLNVPTKTATFPLYDDGTHGDVHAGNAYWSTRLPGVAMVDGMYKFRYILDFTVAGCTTRRELVQSIFVDVVPKPENSGVRVRDVATLTGGGTRVTIDVRPADAFGNLVGPGRADTIRCATSKECAIEPKDVVDTGDGSYVITLVAPSSVAGVRLAAFGTSLDVAIPCDDCSRLAKVSLADRTIKEHSSSKGTVQLSRPSAKSPAGTLVYLNSNKPMVLQVPTAIAVPEGKSAATFPVQIFHAHDQPEAVTVTASYGGDIRSATMTVIPLKRPPSGPPVPMPGYEIIHPSPAGQPNPHSPAHQPKPTPSPATSGEIQAVDISDTAARGPENAPIVLVEFSDYQCGYCASVQDTLRQLLEKYPAKIRHVVKNLPLDFHAYAEPSAIAALAAGRQGKFWEFRQLLFENQNAMSEVDLIRFADRLGLDRQRFDADRRDPQLKVLIERDRQQAAALGVNGTPTFFINGRRIDGARPLAAFQAVVAELLSKPRKDYFAEGVGPNYR